MLRETQLGSLVYVIDHAKDPGFVDKYLEMYG